MKNIIIVALCFTAGAPLFADGTNTFADDKSKDSYAIGMMLGQNFFKRQGVDSNVVDLDFVVQGIKDVQAGTNTLLTLDEMRTTLNTFQKQLSANLQVRNKAAGDAFLAANKTQPGVQVHPVTLPDGKVYELQYQVITNGTGATPSATDVVTVNYRGSLLDGTEFDNSYKRGQPAQFPVSGVIPGWTEALKLMPIGSKWKLFIPGELAYGEKGRPGIPPNATLIFEVELLGSHTPPPPPGTVPTQQPLTSDIIKVPSADEMKKGAKIEVIKTQDLKVDVTQTNH